LRWLTNKLIFVKEKVELGLSIYKETKVRKAQQLLNRQLKKQKYSTMGKIQVNGKEQEIDKPVSVIDLIKQNDVAQPEMVSVQLNGEFVDRDHFSIVTVNTGDEVDFLYFMGGGSYPHKVKYR
jgi:thiamine biosynthesis protein ThiS